MTVDLERLRLELALEVDERVAAGMCGCGCPSPLPAPRGRRRYLNERHRQRGYRRRLEVEARALGVPGRLSQKSLSASIPTGERHADAQTRPTPPQARRSRPRPGVTLYLPTLALAERLLAVLDEGRGVGWDVDELEAAVGIAVTRRRQRDGLEPL